MRHPGLLWGGYGGGYLSPATRALMLSLLSSPGSAYAPPGAIVLTPAPQAGNHAASAIFDGDEMSFELILFCRTGKSGNSVW